jgi:hypothetical protein
MQNIVTESDLRNAILALERKQAKEKAMLKQQFLVAYESVKPINLIKSTLMEAAQSPDMKNNLVNSTIGISAGYLTKALFQGFSGGPVRKIIGTAIMFGIKNLVAHNPEAVRSGGRVLFGFLRKITGKRNHNPKPEKQIRNDYS